MGFLRDKSEQPAAVDPATVHQAFQDAFASGIPAADPSAAAVPPPTTAQPGQPVGFDPNQGPPIDVSSAATAPLPDYAGPVPENKNFLQRLGIDSNGLPPGTGVGGKRSLLDIIGRIADVGATIGGTPVLYQPTLDANTARQRAGVTNDWEQKFNQQRLTKGEHELQGDENVQTAQAVRGLTAVYGNGGPEGDARLAKAFPMIASQLGMKPDEASALWSHIQADPKNALSSLTAALDPTANSTSSQSGDVQMYNLLKNSEHPELAEKFLDNKVNGAPLSAKDRLQLGIQAAKLTNDTRRTGAYVAEHTPAPGGGAGGTGGLTTEALDYAAKNYMTTGKLPPLGQGKAAAATRTAIVNRAEALSRGMGDAHDNPGAFHADFAANAGGLKTMTARSTSILASERTANKNADQVLATMGKGAGTTGIPVLNAWQNRGRNNLGGNPDVARFNTAVTTFANEYAAVVSGGAGANAPTTVHAQQEAMRQINNAMTPQQLAGVIAQMKTEMGNRKAAFADQAAEMRTRMRLPGAATPAHSNLPLMTPEQVRAAPKGTRYRTADGRTGTRP